MTLQMLPQHATLTRLLDECAELGLALRPGPSSDSSDADTVFGPSGEEIHLSFGPDALSPIEQVLQQLEFDFAELPLLVRGESKEIRQLTPRLCLARLLPTAYSYTSNRYGVVPGTDDIRARFSAALFRAFHRDPHMANHGSAFLGLVESPHGPLLAERLVTTCNLEVRVKRFHIGSPTKRYHYVGDHPTAHGGPPLQRWQRFDRPVVCFDWRHPLHGEDGERLADEPLPDDYAALWMDDIPAARLLASDTFRWMEDLFARRGLQLIDICYFIDQSGTMLYGEISPDCMRVRSRASDDAEALDKDEWRSGGDANQVLERYTRLYRIVFGEQ